MSKRAILKGLGAGLAGAGMQLADIEQKKHERQMEERRVSTAERAQAVAELAQQANQNAVERRLEMEQATADLQREIFTQDKLDKYKAMEFKEKELFLTLFNSHLDRIHELKVAEYKSDMEVFMSIQGHMQALDLQSRDQEWQKTYLDLEGKEKERLLEINSSLKIIERARAGELDLLNKEGEILLEYWTTPHPGDNASPEEIAAWFKKKTDAGEALNVILERSREIEVSGDDAVVPVREIPTKPPPTSEDLSRLKSERTNKLATMSAADAQAFIDEQVKENKITQEEARNILQNASLIRRARARGTTIKGTTIY
jgi:hypothetical protein